MTENNRIVVGLDIGTTKICVIVGKKNEYGKLEILGTGKAASEGVIRGMVHNIEKTVNAINKALVEAELQSGVSIGEVNVGIAGQHIRTSIQRGTGFIGSNDGEITRDDVNRLSNEMYKTVITPGNQIIHVMPQDYLIDFRTPVQDPIGMTGTRFESDFHIITADTGAIKNIDKCVKI